MVAPLLRPRDADALRAELRHVSGAAAVPVVFGGEVNQGVLSLTEFFGTRTNGLRGLCIPPSSGLGGAAVVAAKPLSVTDYGSAVTITHHYDGPVLGEGLRSIAAVPVVVAGSTRAVLYGAQRTVAPIGGRTVDLMIRAATRLGLEFTIRDEVDRRLRMHEMLAAHGGGAAVEEIRAIQADLRGLAADPMLDERLAPRVRALASRLTASMSDNPAPNGVPLAPRELDVLSLVALGCTNPEIARRLSLKPETVKSYLRNAATKLNARTRYEAVAKARRHGLLP
jgi:DNA-binding CsgD family transcriptional regulator